MMTTPGGSIGLSGATVGAWIDRPT